MESSVAELLLAGSRLMFIGMSIVFLFLALLVWVIRFSSWLVRRYAAVETVPSAPASDAVAPLASPIEGADLVAAISAAVHRYRNPK
jgi:oxaloacetate decarboxylase gamma subunit